MGKNTFIAMLLMFSAQSCVENRNETNSQPSSSTRRNEEGVDTGIAFTEGNDAEPPFATDAQTAQMQDAYRSDTSDAVIITTDASVDDSANLETDSSIKDADHENDSNGDGAHLDWDGSIDDANHLEDPCDSVDVWGRVRDSGRLGIFHIEYLNQTTWGSDENGSSSLGYIEFIIDDETDDGNCPTYGGTLVFVSEDGLFNEQVTADTTYQERNKSEIYFRGQIGDFNGRISSMLRTNTSNEDFDEMSIDGVAADVEGGFGRIVLHDSTNDDNTRTIAEWKSVGCSPFDFTSLAGDTAQNCCDSGERTRCSNTPSSSACIEAAIEDQRPFYFDQFLGCGKTCIGSTFIALPPEVESYATAWREISWTRTNYGTYAAFRTCETISPYSTLCRGQEQTCVACIGPGAWMPGCSRYLSIDSTNMPFPPWPF